MCQGHFGYFELSQSRLAQPIVIEDFIKWLRVVCLRCGTLLVEPYKVKGLVNQKKLQTAAQLQIVNKVCPVCGEIHPKIKNYEDNLYYMNVITNTESYVMKIDAIQQVFEKISDESCIIMGRSIDSHPRKYFTKYLPIPPIGTRPYYKSILTNKSHRAAPTLDFIKNIIRKDHLTGSSEVKEKNMIFQNKCNHDMIKGGAQKKGDTRTNNVIGGPLNDAIMKNLGGKKGVIRNFQMAHRALSGSRITISGNPTFEIDQVGIPGVVARTLTKMEVVREWNINRLKADIISGRCQRRKSVETGKEHAINDYNKMDVVLEFGDIVYRHIREGDMAIFNRAPSLKETAIGSHKCVPFKYAAENTFQINVSACVNYNADFDGDTMRLKVLRTNRAIAESLYISTIQRWMLSSQKSEAVNGQVQDSVIGSALMTKGGIVFDKMHAMRLWSKTGLELPDFNKKTYTGREIVSMLLEDTPITYRGRARFYNKSYKDYIPYKDDDINVVIKNGVCKSGILDSGSIGQNSSGGIFHIMALEHGTKITLKKIFAYQQVTLKFLEMHGFTMGMDDLIISKEAREKIDRIISEQELKSKLFTEEMIKGEVYPPMGISLSEFYEQQQLRKLSNDNSVFGPIITSLNQEDNGLFQMIMYGSKGKPTNMMSIYGYIGQLQVEGERMPPTFSSYRASVYYPRYAMTPQSKGFVKNSLTQGIDPSMMVYAGSEARQQIVQKSQSTAVSGSNQRKHVKNMENTITGYFRQVNKSFMNIQYLYGENGFDPRYLIRVKLSTPSMTLKQIDDTYHYKATNKKNQPIFDKEVKLIKDDYQKFHEYAQPLESCGIVNGFPDEIQYGIYLDSTIENISKSQPKNENELVNMINLVKEFIDDLPYLYLNEHQKSIKGYIPKYLKSSCFILEMLFRIKFNSKTMLVNTNLELLKHALYTIGLRFIQNLILPGSCVGVQSAQSVGEPMTQMMLDAVHGGSSGASAGLEKSKEILSAKYPENNTNSMWLTLNPNIAIDKVKVENIAEIIKAIKLKDFINAHQIFLEDYKKPVHPKYVHEKSIIEEFEKRNKLLGNIDKRFSRWVIRFELDKKRMMYKSITVENIVERLYLMSSNLYIVYNSELDTDIVIRIYIRESEYIKVNNVKNHTINLLNKMYELLIRGVNNIFDTRVQPIIVRRKDDNGNYIPSNEFMIRTTGLDMKNLVNKAKKLDIDLNGIHIGSVMDTCEYYGIEAARSRIIEQMVQVMEGKSPTYHHLSIYADILTWSGKVKAIERAIRSEKNNTLGRASGYSASKVLMGAAAIGVDESTCSVTAPVMFGSIPRVGTNFCDIIINEQFVKENTKTTLQTLESLN